MGASGRLGALTGRPGLVLLGVVAGSGVHASILFAGSDVLRYLPKTSSGLLAQNRTVVTGGAVDTTGKHACRHSEPNQSPFATVPRLTPVSLARCSVAAGQESRQVVVRDVAHPSGASPGTDPPLSTRRPTRRAQTSIPGLTGREKVGEL